MNCFSFAIVFVAVIAACHGRPGLDSDSGSESNEHNEFGCFIVPDGTTKCPAPTGISCNDRAYLATALATSPSVLYCKGRSLNPRHGLIDVDFDQDLDDCRGSCQCFTVPQGETRGCAALNADPNFAKTSCNNPATLAPVLAAGPTTKVCVYRSNVLSFEGVVRISADLDD